MKTPEDILKEHIKPPFEMPCSELLIYKAMKEYAMQLIDLAAMKANETTSNEILKLKDLIK